MFNRPLFVCAFALLAPSMTLAETETCQKVADKDIAALFVRWNDALLLNTGGRLVDSCIANLFIIKNEKIITPALSEGPVDGIMRRQLLRHFPIVEASLQPEDLETADEIFLSNAIRGIRWVRQCGDRLYTNSISARLYQQLRQTI